MIPVLTALRARISDNKVGTVGLASALCTFSDGRVRRLRRRFSIRSGKNNACIICRNICSHVTTTALAVEPSANGERAHVKKHINR